MAKTNCWEFKRCGRQPGGAHVVELGVCPAATVQDAHGIHDGQNGGRACWAIVGTLCKGQVQDSLVAKMHHCVGCDFRSEVESDTGADLLTPAEIANRLTAWRSAAV